MSASRPSIRIALRSSHKTNPKKEHLRFGMQSLSGYASLSQGQYDSDTPDLGLAARFVASGLEHNATWEIRSCDYKLDITLHPQNPLKLPHGLEPRHQSAPHDGDCRTNSPCINTYTRRPNYSSPLQ